MMPSLIPDYQDSNQTQEIIKDIDLILDIFNSLSKDSLPYPLLKMMKKFHSDIEL